MSLPPIVPDTAQKIRVKFQKTRNFTLLVLSGLLILCIALAWTTRDAMIRLPFMQSRGRATGSQPKSAVDLSPWQTAQALAALAVTAEELEYARDAERLADHEVDQAFAAALRQATLQAQRHTFTGRAFELSLRVNELQEVVKQDLLQVDALTKAAETQGSAGTQTGDTDLDIAKAQLQLDSDQLEDAQQDLARASGDNRAQIQSELAAREAAMKKYDESRGVGQLAVIAAVRDGTLSSRIRAWNRQRSRYQLLQQAIDQTQQNIRSLTDEHNALEAQANAKTPATGDTQNAKDRLASIRARSAQQQLLSIYDDRIQTLQELAGAYGKWSEQVLRQHRIVLHLILQSIALILLILILTMLGAGLVRRLMSRFIRDPRQTQTLRMILVLSVQAIGAMLVLFVIFGAPHQTPTILGLTTAALTIALQDFILAFLGWFRLVGKRGIRVGDWVEINGVGGEVIEIGLMTTTLLETGNLADRGYPTGRRITFMNGYAIRGQFFNFSTTGQWTWDEITVGVPQSVDAHAAVDRILQAVQEETEESSRIAEQEWKRGMRGETVSKFRTDPAVNLRPSGSGVDLEVRYVVRASERFEMRNRLYRRVFNLLHESPQSAQSEVVR
jgi:small-conductance mechanosensitive channel